MDIQQASPPQGLTAKQARDWIRNMHSYSIDNDNGAPSTEGLASLLPGRLKTALKLSEDNTQALAARFGKWLVEEGLLDIQDRGWKTTTAGLGFSNASLNKRKGAEAAWDEVAGLLARAAWNNLSNPAVAPFEIKDIFLFGSMTDHARSDYGDADVFVLSSAKGKTKLEQDVIWAAAHALGREIYLEHSSMGHSTSWERLLGRCLKNGRDFISQLAGMSHFQTFEDMGKPATALSLFDIVWTEASMQESGAYKPYIPTTISALGRSKENEEALRTQLAKACTRLGLKGLPEILRGREPTAAELRTLAKVAVAPMVARTAKRLANSAAHDQEHAPLNQPPDDSMRALWWASGVKEGYSVALHACHEKMHAGAIAAGTMVRSLQDDAPMFATKWTQAYEDWAKDLLLDPSQRNVLDMEFKGDLSHRPDLAPLKKWYLPKSIELQGMDGNWDKVREWMDRGGTARNWVKSEGSTQPWSLLLQTLSMEHLTTQDRIERVNAYQAAGLSLEGLDRKGYGVLHHAVWTTPDTFKILKGDGIDHLKWNPQTNELPIDLLWSPRWKDQRPKQILEMDKELCCGHKSTDIVIFDRDYGTTTLFAERDAEKLRQANLVDKISQRRSNKSAVGKQAPSSSLG